MSDRENIVDFTEERFRRSSAGKICAACDKVDAEITKLLYVDKIPAHEVLVAMAHRLGIFLGTTNADIENVSAKFGEVIKKAAKSQRNQV